MVIDNFRNKFKDAIDILKTFNKNGYEAYFVGGCVRDYLLGEEFSDIDITTNALPEEVKKIFRKSIDTGIQHGTVTILVNGEGYEVTTFRTEDEYTNHRAPEKVEFVNNLREDLDRRDFTINAMALDSNGVLFDYHNGEKDLSSGVIRTVNNPNERFYEDALRMLRAFRFSSKLDFELEKDTLEAIKKNAELIKFVSIERIVNEFKKLLSGKGNLRSLELLLDSKLNNYIPFLEEIKIIQDFSKYLFCQSLYILSKINNISFDILKTLKLSNKEVKLIKEFDKINVDFMSEIPLELILYKHNFEDVVFVAEYFSYNNRHNIENCKLTINSFDDVDITSQEIISIIGEKPGPWIKSVVSELEHEILLNRLNNNRKDILDFLLKMRDNK
ncbi:CCA tRNA nucleotidyltransferase [uncultured Gemella sp.]|uniref:CCA tRNA nucleotidyltransferase n=1 Tax=uncultured Gemella sp. TaxID=254352 RepID=UPI0028D03424|nr:CCA tRNA nucleotidyltransferase [uncultured Gemella sp.]